VRLAPESRPQVARARRWVSLPILTLLFLLASPHAAAAGPCPNESSPGFRSYLPECRGYEQVSPSYKEGYLVTGRGASSDGSQVLVESPGNFLTPAGTLPESIGVFGHTYRMVRTETGWAAIAVDAPAGRFRNFAVQSMSIDFAGSLWFASVPGQLTEDVFRDSSGGAVTSVGPGAPPGAKETALNFSGASDNLLHAVFTVHSANVGLEEEHLWPGDTTFGERRVSLYEYAGSERAEPRLVGVSDEHEVAHIGESHLISNCGTYPGSFPEGELYNAISDTGETVFFSARECAGTPAVSELYARMGAKKTIAVSEPTHPLVQGSGPGPEECAAACEGTPHQPGVFQGASRDGSKVFFLSSQPLLNGDTDNGTDLYEAEISGEGAQAKLTRLIQVSAHSNAGELAEVQGVARVSQDGSHAYFVARGVLTSGPRGGSAGSCLAGLGPVALAEEEAHHEGRCRPKKEADNLYVYERDARYPSGHTAFVATLSASRDSGDWSLTDGRPVQVTPDGGFVVFQSTADLTPDQEERAEAGQIFEYDAKTETLTRVSRGQRGYNEDGNSSTIAAKLPIARYDEADRPTERLAHLAISADGARVFFSTENPLTPQATAGTNNVYEYHDGETSLISDGHDLHTIIGQPTTKLIGTDESGLDVYFETADPLVPQDGDTQVDVYDARIGGGFPAPPSAPRCECQGSPSPAPVLQTPGSGNLQAGNGNLPVSATATTPKRSNGPKLARALKACRKKHAKRQRTACERSARKRYAIKRSTSSRSRK
jgi:hypothetical protein